ncbi:MAG: hypothetical protein KF873_23040 [Gemmataceae bacterium]|nr:hypothetical protein [Gemmataceae bacterium]
MGVDPAERVGSHRGGVLRLRRPAGHHPSATGAHRRARWAIEDLFELAKGDCGLDECEVRKLLLKLVWAFVPDAEQVLAWSLGRQRHQHRARGCHYRKRGAEPPD